MQTWHFLQKKKSLQHFSFDIALTYVFLFQVCLCCARFIEVSGEIIMFNLFLFLHSKTTLVVGS